MSGRGEGSFRIYSDGGGERAGWPGDATGVAGPWAQNGRRAFMCDRRVEGVEESGV